MRKIAHIPYGYRIEHGIAVINEEQAENIRSLYKLYLSGQSLVAAAKESGINVSHGSAGKMLRNERYLGDDYYPIIIDKETFEEAEIERLKRAKKLGRIFEPREDNKTSISKRFIIKKPNKQHINPFKQAEYMYSLIESEEEHDGG